VSSRSAGLLPTTRGLSFLSLSFWAGFACLEGIARGRTVKLQLSGRIEEEVPLDTNLPELSAWWPSRKKLTVTQFSLSQETSAEAAQEALLGARA
jgi:hypothetical protein